MEYEAQILLYDIPSRQYSGKLAIEKINHSVPILFLVHFVMVRESSFLINKTLWFTHIHNVHIILNNIIITITYQKKLYFSKKKRNIRETNTYHTLSLQIYIYYHITWLSNLYTGYMYVCILWIYLFTKKGNR